MSGIQKSAGQVLLLIEATYVGRVTTRKSYNDMMGWACVRDLAPLIKQWEVRQIYCRKALRQALEQKSDASDELPGAQLMCLEAIRRCKETFEVMLSLIHRGADILKGRWKELLYRA